MAPISAVPPTPTFAPRGFTLTELAIVLFIVSLMIGGMLLPLSAQQDIRARSETTRIINEAKEALLGYVAVNGRFPCPAAAGGDGREVLEIDGATCTHPNDGFLPAATLGLSSTANDGYAYDGWSNESSNRLRYAISAINGSALTKMNGIKTTGIGALAGDLFVCNTGTGITVSDCGTTARTLTNNAILVIYSLGKNAASGGSSTDELPNADGGPIFVSAPISASYDDALEWLSPNVLVGRLIAAGQLP